MISGVIVTSLRRLCHWRLEIA